MVKFYCVEPSKTCSHKRKSCGAVICSLTHRPIHHADTVVNTKICDEDPFAKQETK